MNEIVIKTQLFVDEGYRLNVYKDSLGILTVGIGHEVLPSDGLFLGDKITDERVQELFQHDFIHAVAGVSQLVTDFDNLPDDVQGVLVNMCFNMGPSRIAGFKHFLAAISARNWKQAAIEMRNSLWFNQVGQRAIRLYNIINQEA